jgi:hypothetical protein
MTAEIYVGHIRVGPEIIGDAMFQLDSIELGRAFAVWMSRMKDAGTPDDPGPGWSVEKQMLYVRQALSADVKAFLREMLEEPKP